jgi:hypothetical protein
MSAYDVKAGLKYGATGLTFSNKHFDPVAGSRLGSRLYGEYLEAIYLRRGGRHRRRRGGCFLGCVNGQILNSPFEAE